MRNLNSSKKYVLELADRKDTEKLMQAFTSLTLNQNHELVFREESGLLFSILHFIAEQKIPVQKLEHMEIPLEDLFLEVTKP